MFIKTLFIIVFFVIFFAALIILRPGRLHRKRPFSTAFLKFSYLTYLLVALVFVYLFMFYNERMVYFLEDINNPKSAMHFTVMLFCLFVPNAAIFLRRKIKRRKFFNNTSGIINILSTLYYLYLIKNAVTF